MVANIEMDKVVDKVADKVADKVVGGLGRGFGLVVRIGVFDGSGRAA